MEKGIFCLSAPAWRSEGVAYGKASGGADFAACLTQEVELVLTGKQL